VERRKAILLAAAGSTVPVVALADRKQLAGVPLVWKPTDELGKLTPVNITGLSGRRIELKPLVDGRENRERIGENREDAEKGKVYAVTTRDDVPAFITERFRYLARYFGLDTVREPGDVTIAGEVRTFFVTETNTYEGDVSLKICVAGQDGVVRWEGVTLGGASRWGRSYKAENYYETLSDSLIRAVHKLLVNPDFMAALRQ
jgi:hypothetical protein